MFLRQACRGLFYWKANRQGKGANHLHDERIQRIQFHETIGGYRQLLALTLFQGRWGRLIVFTWESDSFINANGLEVYADSTHFSFGNSQWDESPKRKTFCIYKCDPIYYIFIDAMQEITLNILTFYCLHLENFANLRFFTFLYFYFAAYANDWSRLLDTINAAYFWLVLNTKALKYSVASKRRQRLQGSCFHFSIRHGRRS